MKNCILIPRENTGTVANQTQMTSMERANNFWRNRNKNSADKYEFTGANEQNETDSKKYAAKHRFTEVENEISTENSEEQTEWKTYFRNRRKFGRINRQKF